MSDEHWFYCEKCETHTPSRPSRLPRSEDGVRYNNLYAPQMRWLRKARKCLACGTVSDTGELNAEFLEEFWRLQVLSSHYENWQQERIKEIVELKSTISEMKFTISYDIPLLKDQIAKREKEIEKLEKSLANLERQMSAIPSHIVDQYCNEGLVSLWRSAPWLKEGTAIPRSLCGAFIEASAWWLTHSSGSPVRAPRHSERIYNHRNHGWVLEFGANTFLVEQMLIRSRYSINNYAKNPDGDTERLKKELAQIISGAVANYEGSEYSVYYPITDGLLIFGAQAIDTQDGVSFLLSRSLLPTGV